MCFREYHLFEYLEYIWEEMGLEQWAEIVTYMLTLPTLQKLSLPWDPMPEGTMSKNPLWEPCPSSHPSHGSHSTLAWRERRCKEPRAALSPPPQLGESPAVIFPSSDLPANAS